MLPISEDLKLSMNLNNMKNDFSLFQEATGYLIEIALSLKNKDQIIKLLKMIMENLDLNKLNQNKIYKVEIHFLQLYEVIRQLSLNDQDLVSFLFE